MYNHTHNVSDIIAKIHQEFEYILAVLISTKDMKFDLTEVFFMALDGVNQNIFAITKSYLKANPKK
jgi:hypothetical protein